MWTKALNQSKEPEYENSNNRKLENIELIMIFIIWDIKTALQAYPFISSYAAQRQGEDTT